MNYDKDRWREHFVSVEGNVSHFYLDGEGVVTIGIGCQVFEPRDLPLVWKTNGIRADGVAITQEYRAVKAMPGGHLPEYYGKVCALYLPNADVDRLFFARLDVFIQSVEDSIVWLEDYPDSARLALIDMAFNLGVEGLKHKFPKFMTAFLAKDWSICARECFRQGIQPERNDWTRQSFEGLAKAA